jgi:hypothetical protein
MGSPRLLLVMGWCVLVLFVFKICEERERRRKRRKPERKVRVTASGKLRHPSRRQTRNIFCLAPDRARSSL